MKIIKFVALPEPYVHKNSRNDIRKDIERYYLGQTRSLVGFAYGSLKDGKLHCPYAFRRKDIFCVQYAADSGCGCNVFIHADGRYQIDEYLDTELTPEERQVIKEYVVQLMQKEASYVEEQRKFLERDQEIRLAIENKTPEEAVEILKSLEMEIYGRLLY